MISQRSKERNNTFRALPKNVPKRVSMFCEQIQARTCFLFSPSTALSSPDRKEKVIFCVGEYEVQVPFCRVDV